MILAFLLIWGNHHTSFVISKIHKKPTLQKKTKSTTTSPKKQYKKKEVKSKKKKIRIFSQKVALNAVNTIESFEIHKGILYKKMQFGVEPRRILVHVVEVDIDSTPYEVKILKAKNIIDGLDYLKNIYDDFQFELTRVYGGDLLAVANANFWSAFRNYPIGILVCDGEVISMKKYKEWSTVFFDLDNRPYIDNFQLTGEIVLGNGKKIVIDNVNKRSESDISVLYNKYFGDTIPKVHFEDIEKEVQETISALYSNIDLSDSTEIAVDTNEIRNQIIQSHRQESKEFTTIKLIFKYLEPTLINRKVKVEFVGIDSGVVEIPADGFVVTLAGVDVSQIKLKKGEVCHLLFSTDRHSYIAFKSAVSGTPRLVRKGIAKHEAYQEGSRGFRFIASQLPRTAIGTNMSKTKFYLFIAEASKPNQSLGANLSQLSYIAKRIGCFDAMNLDGGGSSIMLVGGKRVGGNEESNGRRISGAIGITFRK